MILSAFGLLFTVPLSTAVVLRNDQSPDLASLKFNESLQWGACDPNIVQNPSISCAFFTIPLDYHDAHAGSGRIAVAKINATGERLGSVFLNPGGPGGSGLDSLNTIGPELVALGGGHYDIVSWDPRGVGPLTIPGDIFCFDSVEEYNGFWNGTIELNGIEMTGNFTDPADVQALLSQAPIMQKKYEELGQRCMQHPTGKYLKYVGTAATVRDMVALADALDGPDAPINYVGTSYGTLLGSWFINMFPERVGHVLLDGVVNPVSLATQETPYVWDEEAADADKVYEGLVTGCALAGPQACTVAQQGDSAVDVDATIQALLKKAHDATRKNSSVSVTSAAIRSQIAGALYSPAQWAALANTSYPEAVAAVDAESVGITSASGTRRSLRRRQMNDTVSYTTEAILCSDSVDQRGTSMKTILEDVITASRTSSRIASAVWPAPFRYCPFWPVRAVERYQGPFNKTLANKILVASNKYDPVTPLANAQALVDILGDQARLVVQDGFGHTTGSSPSQCFDEVAFAYFVNGMLPDGNDTVCEVDADFEIFNNVNTEDIVAAMTNA
ncbi:alpha/beta-hydrolase [Trametes coccinea BRFM310]|uniref:Alpha/beta-hydrolase n=1 Tax=Trametes coccinea (strain BRFM310) TaxID=1353009 RepID=A0A1Y2II29_TRAC3|nr:alpha/beta-hydrolase [Trametes coccinea BRFM310]